MHHIFAVAIFVSVFNAAAHAQEIPTLMRMPVRGVLPEDFDQRVQRVLEDAQNRGADALVLDIDVWQGNLQTARTAFDWIAASDIPVHAMITGVAHEVGALLALAAGSVFMTPGSSIGGRVTGLVEIDVELENDIEEMRREFRLLAERRGMDVNLADAMANPGAALPGVVDSTAALTLTAQGALQLGVATGIVADLDDVAGKLQLANALVVSANARGFTGATIEIENNSWRDLRVYLVRGGSRRRLGMATSMSKREYVIEPGEVGMGIDIRLLADPVGGAADHATQTIRMMPGIVIQWQLQNNPSQSSVFIFRP